MGVGAYGVAGSVPASGAVLRMPKRVRVSGPPLFILRFNAWEPVTGGRAAGAALAAPAVLVARRIPLFGNSYHLHMAAGFSLPVRHHRDQLPWASTC